MQAFNKNRLHIRCPRVAIHDGHAASDAASIAVARAAHRRSVARAGGQHRTANAAAAHTARATCPVAMPSTRNPEVAGPHQATHCKALLPLGLRHKDQREERKNAANSLVSV